MMLYSRNVIPRTCERKSLESIVSLLEFRSNCYDCTKGITTNHRHLLGNKCNYTTQSKWTFQSTVGRSKLYYTRFRKYNHIQCGNDDRGIRRPEMIGAFSSSQSSSPFSTNPTQEDERSRQLSESNNNNNNSAKNGGKPGLDKKAIMEIWKQAQTIPNMLTLSRIFGAPVLSYCIVNHMYAEALSGCFIAAFSDYLDGHIARKYPDTQATVLGTYLDPMADKILINVLAVSLCYDGILPGPMVGLWLLKDVGLIVTCYQAVADNTPEGAAVMDPLRTPLKVTPTTISKVNTFLQFTTISLGLIQPTVVMASSLSYLNTLSTILPPPQTLDYLCWTTAGTTVASVLSYVDGASLKMNKKGGGKPPNKNNL